MGVEDGSFAVVLRRFRLAAGLTQEELAERAAISTRAVSDLERSLKTRPYRHTVHELARALNLSSADQALLETAVNRKRRPRLDTSSPQPSRPLHPLPMPPTAILGREREIALVVQHLRRKDQRLVTLTGAGGVGKTRLALEVARQLAADYSDGVAFVSLAALTDSTLAPSAIATAIGIVSTGTTPPEQGLLTFLAGRDFLIVLDNLEHLLPAVPLVGRLLAGAPGLKVLVTSRVSLRLRGEQEIDIRPLTLPRQRRLPPLEEVGNFAAVALFLQRAQAVQPRFVLTTKNATAVVEICRKLDGLPLALELAATRIKLLSPQALLDRLSSRLDLLTGGAADAPVRQQTLRSTIGWSYSLLDEAEQALFARLSVFTGGFALDAVEAICTLAGEPKKEMLSRLASLVEKSLLTTDGTEEPRFLMLETIREYAHERLEAASIVQILQLCHFQFYLAMAEQVAAKAEEVGQAARLDRVDAEYDNLRAALQWAGESGNVELGLRLAISLGRYWAMRGSLGEGLRWLSEFLAHKTGVLPELRAAALYAAAQLASQRQSGEAAELFEQSLMLYRALGDKQRIAEAVIGLAFETLNLGDLARAEDLLEESVTLGRELGDKNLLATSLHLLAGLAAGQGDTERSKDLGEQSRALYEELAVGGQATDVLPSRVSPLHGMENSRQASVPLKPLPAYGALWRDYALGLAFDARNWGDYRHAVHVLEAVLVQTMEMGDRRYAAYPRAALGMMAREQGDYDRAIVLYEEALAVFQAVGDDWGTGSALIGLSDVARDQGDARRVIEFAAPGLRLFRKVGDLWFTGYSLHNLGLAARYQGDYGQAEALFAESLATFRKLRGEGTAAEVLTSVGLLALEQGDDKRAEQALAESLRVAGRIGLRWIVGTALEGMASIAVSRDQAERAARLFGAAEAVRTAIGTPIWPANQALYERHIGATRLVLEQVQFMAAWQEGRALTTDEAISAALNAGTS